MNPPPPPLALNCDLSEYIAAEGPSTVHSIASLTGEPTYLEAQLPGDVFLAPVGGSAASETGSGSASGTGSSLPQSSQLGLNSLSPHTVPGAPRGTESALEPDLPERGAIIDKYRIEALVGVGGFAVVYRATHLLLHTPVALKMLRPKVLRRRPELAPLLCDEARFAARIDHPNVVRVFDVTHTPHITYMVTEYVDGGSLAESISKGGRMPPGKAIRVAIDVAEGLAAGLRQGLIHRDIKPANILLTRKHQAKIADLGLAQLSKEVAPNVSSVLDNKGMVGTPGYMAPEQALDARTIDFRADIYALGVTLYHAAVGEPPFPLKDRQRSIELHRSAPVPAPSTRVQGFPPLLERVILKMLAKTPSDRHDSYASLIDELRKAGTAHP